MDEPIFTFDDSFVRDLNGMYEPWRAAVAPTPELLVLNETLAADLGLDASLLATADGIAVLVGNEVTPGSSPVAQGYAGHQFGGYSPRLGDGRALLLGEIHDGHGNLLDVHLKGSGRTPYARGGDGKAAIGPMLREYLISEAMHALGVPTTRSLAVMATGDKVARDIMLPGAVLVRVAASHLRVGSFQYAAAHHDPTLIRRLADYSIARHYPEAGHAENPYLALLASVVTAQAQLISQWMQLGFIHGVMNTDNMTISGETIDYGPCAFMDAYDPATVFSSIDHGGRYAYGNQPAIAQWNLARLAETLLPLIDSDTDAAIAAATSVLQDFTEQFGTYWSAGVRAKLGLISVEVEVEVEVGEVEVGDGALIDDLFAVMVAGALDYTSALRWLSAFLRADTKPAPSGFVPSEALKTWAARWRLRVTSQPGDPVDIAAAMDRLNPLYIPRNHRVEEALSAATDGDMGPFRRLLDVVSDPFTQRPGLDAYAAPADRSTAPYRTFCGT